MARLRYYIIRDVWGEPQRDGKGAIKTYLYTKSKVYVKFNKGREMERRLCQRKQIELLAMQRQEKLYSVRSRI